MANTAKLLTGDRPLFYGNQPVHVYHVICDTTGADITIRAAATGRMNMVVGASFSETDAMNIKFGLEESSPDDYHTLELAANQGALTPVFRPIFATATGEALTIQSSVAFSSMLLYVIETDRFDIK